MTENGMVELHHQLDGHPFSPFFSCLTQIGRKVYFPFESRGEGTLGGPVEDKD